MCDFYFVNFLFLNSLRGLEFANKCLTVTVLMPYRDFLLARILNSGGKEFAKINF